MKILKVILLSAVVLATVLTVSAQEKGEEVVVFNVTMDAASKAKLEKEIPSEKGIKKVVVNMEAQTVAITYQEDEISLRKLQKEIEKLGVDVKEPKEPIKETAKKSVDKKSKKGKGSKNDKGFKSNNSFKNNNGSKSNNGFKSNSGFKSSNGSKSNSGFKSNKGSKSNSGFKRR